MPQDEAPGVASRAGPTARLVVVLGALTAFGPMSIDMYLPAFPTLEKAFATPASEVQLTLTSVMIGLAAGQAFVGPVSDALGRRRPLVAGLVAYVAASAICAVAPSVPVLIAARLLQGLAGAAGIVIARAIVRDLFGGAALARVFSWLMLVMGAAPILAPTIGGAILRFSSWRGVFVVLAAYGVLTLLLSLTLPETLPAGSRRSGTVRDVLRTFRTLLADRSFVGYSLAGALATGSMFAYIAGSPFVLQDMYGVSPLVYALIFGTNAAGIIACSQLNRRLLASYDLRPLLVAGLALSAAGAAALLAAVVSGIGLAGILPALFVVVSMVGVVNPNATALALADHPEAAGSASGVFGVIQFVLGALIAPLVGIAGTHTALPLALTTAVCGAAGLASLRLSSGSGPAVTLEPSLAPSESA